MDADGPGLLGQPDDVLLDVFAGGHHQVRHLVGDDHDERQPFRDVGRFVVRVDLQPPEDFVASEVVVAVDVTHADFGQQAVAFLHLVDGPRQDRLGLFHVRDDRVHQVWQPPVTRQLDHLGVDHQHPHVVRPARHQHAANDRVEAHRFPGPRPPGDQQVRHLRQINHQWVARNVLAQEHRDVHPVRLVAGFFDHVADADDLPRLVGHLDADGVLARDRCDDPHAGHPQPDRDVVGQPRDLRQPQAGLQLDLILGDHRAGFDLDDADVVSEFGERLFEQPRLAADFVQLFVVGNVVAGGEQIDRRQRVHPAVAGGFRQSVE